MSHVNWKMYFLWSLVPFKMMPFLQKWEGSTMKGSNHIISSSFGNWSGITGFLGHVGLLEFIGWFASLEAIFTSRLPDKVYLTRTWDMQNISHCLCTLWSIKPCHFHIIVIINGSGRKWLVHSAFSVRFRDWFDRIINIHDFFFKPGNGRCFPHVSFFLYNPVYPGHCEHSFDGVCW